jgi:glycosyltransferase involved in cell wall biosynthesis
MIDQLKKSVKRFIQGNYLPCYILNRDPLVVIAFDRDFTSRKSEFLKNLAGRGKVYLFLQLGWQHETARMAEPFAAELLSVMAEMPELSITVLANSTNEVEILTRLGVAAVLCQQNAFLDERRYPILRREKKYDAIYIARISPFKRHRLAEKVASLRLIGSYYEQERPYVDEVFAALKHASYRRQVRAAGVPAEIAQAKCGLCLSREEGAMFVSAEYLLCGIPIVETAALGGRRTIYPPFAYREVPEDPDAVAAAVAEYADSRPEPKAIREAVIRNMEKERDVFRSLLNRILEKHGKPPFRDRFPHKLGLRLTRTPWANWRHGLKA